MTDKITRSKAARLSQRNCNRRRDNYRRLSGISRPYHLLVPRHAAPDGTQQAPLEAQGNRAALRAEPLHTVRRAVDSPLTHGGSSRLTRISVTLAIVFSGAEYASIAFPGLMAVQLAAPTLSYMT